jgi:hypothetical protein
VVAVAPVSSRDRGALVVTLAVLGLGLTLAGRQLAAAAATTPADDYTNAVLRTLAYVRLAEKGDEPSLPRAIDAIQPIAKGQPEVLRDLTASAPDLVDADARLSSLLDALRSRADVADPGRSRAELEQVLSMPRYAGVNAPPPWWQRALIWALQQLARLLSLIGAGRLVIPPLAFLLAAGAVLMLILAWLARALRDRVTVDRRRRPAPASAPAPVDYFALADSRAAAGEYSSALWALAAGVASALNGQRVWTSSPLTVREIFRGAPAPATLSPLLRAFEAAAYGHHQADAQTYGSAARAAAPFRREIAT